MLEPLLPTLLLPMLGNAEIPDRAHGTVTQALTHCGVAYDAARALATSLLGEPEPGEGPRWTVTADSPIVICSSPYSPRHIPLALGITSSQAHFLADALDACG
ncbi:hypothetical protein GCM10010260_73420 [Streptomyces filipinensis]|uniref:Uncharacterized protein n=1 Tax=Streptomyces filipinensis TaxID=66887 RepID=A0A918MFP4_9ACTN|nr:hypothetical protein GCM10010260_73420 [Streptomyces filipinensis]